MEVTKVPKKIVTVIEPKRSMTVDKEKYRQKKVAAYCRVSTDSEEQLVSYANQKKVYTEMIASRKDWCFAGLFADEGKSGTRADKRPEFNKMINDCLAGKIDYIITKSVSRFARNTVDCLDYVRMLKSKGIGVYFEEQQIDTLKTDSELYLVIYAGFAQSESESISKNITWSVRKKFEEGTPVFIYKRFLGYKKGADGEPEIVPSEAAIVERIFNLYLAGETVDNISKMMQAETVVLLSKGEIDSKKVRVEFSLEDMDMSEFQDGATYPQIKEYVLEHTGLKVSNLYISQIKRKCGLEVGKNYNLPKSEDSRQPQCPPEKEKAIREAFKYFGMI